jgi:hypothetical protein
MNIYKYILFKAAESFISSLVSSFNGNAKQDYPHPSSKTRPGLANLQKIYWRAKPHEAVDAAPDKNFILKHFEWVEPDYVLKVGLASFYKITKLGFSGECQLVWGFTRWFFCVFHNDKFRLGCVQL